MNSLSEKYRPRLLAEIRGQSRVVKSLFSFIKRPAARAFIFSGTPGTGKTSAAYALANELGVDVDKREWGGLHEIASGELTADTVREMFRTTLRFSSWHGSGWKVVLCNEADNMSDKAAFIFLDVLEHLPAKCVVVFTTNDLAKLPRRLRERCECHEFTAAAASRDQESGLPAGVTEAEIAAQSLIDHVWQTELGHNHSPRLADLQGWQDCGNVSFRAVLQSLEPLIREQLEVESQKEASAPPAKRPCIRVELPAKPAKPAERSTMDILEAAAARALAFQQSLAGA